MIGKPYKRTFAAKGSALYAALEAEDAVLAKRIYDFTTARYEATMNGFPSPVERPVTDDKGNVLKVSIVYFGKDGQELPTNPFKDK